MVRREIYSNVFFTGYRRKAYEGYYNSYTAHCLKFKIERHTRNDWQQGNLLCSWFICQRINFEINEIRVLPAVSIVHAK